MAAVRTAHPCDLVVEDPAVEVAVDRRLHAAAQVAVGRGDGIALRDLAYERSGGWEERGRLLVPSPRLAI